MEINIIAFDNNVIPIFFLKKEHHFKNFYRFTGIFLLTGRHTFFSSPETPACLLSQFLWFNKYIQTEDDPACFTKFAAKACYSTQVEDN